MHMGGRVGQAPMSEKKRIDFQTEPSRYRHWRLEKDGNVAPQRKLANEKPKGETVDYDTLVKSWPATPPKRAEAK